MRAIWRPRQPQHPIRMLLDQLLALAILHIVNPNRIIRPTTCQPRAISTKRQCKQHIPSSIQIAHDCPIHRIKQLHFPHFPWRSTGRRQNRSIRRIGQLLRPLCNISDPPHQFSIRSIPKGNLMITPRRQLLSISAERQRHNRRRPRIFFRRLRMSNRRRQAHQQR